MRLALAVATLALAAGAAAATAAAPPPSEEAQRGALQDFYRATGGGALWADPTWLAPNSSYCTWTGVSCAPDSRAVRAVQLPGFGGRGPLPASMARLTELQRLVVRPANAAAGLGITAVPAGSLPVSLRVIDLSQSPALGLPDDLFAAGYPALAELSVSLCGLERLPASLGPGTPALAVLLADGNRLRALPEGLAEVRGPLAAVLIANNPGLAAFPAVLGRVPRGGVVRLLMGNCSAGLDMGGAAGALSRMTALLQLDLSSNRLAGPAAWASALPPSVTYLHAPDNNLTSLPPLGALPNLALLDVSENPRLARLPEGDGAWPASLSFVGLHGCALSRLPCGLLAAAPQVSTLLLQRNELTLADGFWCTAAEARAIAARPAASAAGLVLNVQENAALGNAAADACDSGAGQAGGRVFALDPRVLGGRLTSLLLDGARSTTNLTWMASCGQFPRLTLLSLSRTGVTTLRPVLDANPVAFPLLQVLAAEETPMEVDERTMVLLAGQVPFVNLRNARPAGRPALPALPAAPAVSPFQGVAASALVAQQLDFRGTGAVFGPPNSGGSAPLVPSAADASTDRATGLECPGWRLADNGGLLLVSPAFFMFDGCACVDDAKYWAMPECRPCPGFVACGGRATAAPDPATRLPVRRGFYPLDAATGRPFLDPLRGDDVAAGRAGGVPCGGRAAGGACNPRQGAAFDCGEGLDRASRLCSRCLPHHWRVSSAACGACTASAGIGLAVVLLAAAVAAALAWSAARGSPGTRGGGLGTVASATVFFLAVSHTAWQYGAPNAGGGAAYSALVHSVRSVLFLHPGAAACWLSPEGREQFGVSVWLALAASACTAAAYGVAVLAALRSRRGQRPRGASSGMGELLLQQHQQGGGLEVEEEEEEDRKPAAAVARPSAVLLAGNALRVPVLTVLLRPLACRTEELPGGASVSFLASHPDVPCGHVTYTAASVAGLALVAAQAAAAAWLVHAAPRLVPFLCSGSVPWWRTRAVAARDVLLAVLFALGATAAGTALTLASLLLWLYVVAVALARPYLSPEAGIADALSAAAGALVCTAAASFQLGNGDADGNGAVAVLVAAAPAVVCAAMAALAWRLWRRRCDDNAESEA